MVYFEGKLIDKALLPQRIGNRMLEISKQESGFSFEIIRVEIVSPDVPNIVLMDLPGIIPSSVDPVKKQTVEKIVQYYARDPNYSLIVVLKCTEHHETLGDIALLDDLMKLDLTADFPSPRNNWKKESVMIVNRINSIMPDRASSIAMIFYIPFSRRMTMFLLMFQPQFPNLPKIIKDIIISKKRRRNI